MSPYLIASLHSHSFQHRGRCNPDEPFDDIDGFKNEWVARLAASPISDKERTAGSSESSARLLGVFSSCDPEA